MKFKKGDKVYWVGFGNGVVVDIITRDNGNFGFPVLVKFEESKEIYTETFTTEGFMFREGGKIKIIKIEE